jgi:hypothetical protein
MAFISISLIRPLFLDFFNFYSSYYFWVIYYLSLIPLRGILQMDSFSSLELQSTLILQIYFFSFLIEIQPSPTFSVLSQFFFPIFISIFAIYGAISLPYAAFFSHGA